MSTSNNDYNISLIIWFNAQQEIKYDAQQEIKYDAHRGMNYNAHRRRKLFPKWFIILAFH